MCLQRARHTETATLTLAGHRGNEVALYEGGSQLSPITRPFQAQEI